MASKKCQHLASKILFSIHSDQTECFRDLLITFLILELISCTDGTKNTIFVKLIPFFADGKHQRLINDATASQGFLYGKLNSLCNSLFKVFFKDVKWGRRKIIVLQRILYGV